MTSRGIFIVRVAIRATLMTLGISGLAVAQPAVSRSVTSAGGNISASGRARAHSTVGQSIIGLAATIHQGFWWQPVDNSSKPSSVADDAMGSSTMLHITPSPASGGATLVFSMVSAGNVIVRLTDIQGATVLSNDYGLKPPGDCRIMVDVSALPSGAYIASVNSGTETRVSRIIVEH
jgi:hypothetical protein